MHADWVLRRCGETYQLDGIRVNDEDVKTKIRMCTILGENERRRRYLSRYVHALNTLLFVRSRIASTSQKRAASRTPLTRIHVFVIIRFDVQARTRLDDTVKL